MLSFRSQRDMDFDLKLCQPTSSCPRYIFKRLFVLDRILCDVQYREGIRELEPVARLGQVTWKNNIVKL